MTPDQIKDAAIEAAHKEFCKLLKKGPPGGAAMKCAIDAYEAAMNQQPEKAPMDELVLAKRRDYLFSPNLWIVARRISAIGEWQCVYGTRYQDREILYFRPLPLPLPQPPEVK